MQTQTDDDIVAVLEPLRRFVRAHSASSQDVEDVVQETVARVIEAGDRLSLDTTLGYSIVVARHVMADQAARAGMERRRAHRLVDLRRPASPEDVVVLDEDRAAVVSALTELPFEERELLLAHVLDDEPIADIASSSGATQGSVTARLLRMRARLRLDYVLAVRNVELPTKRCRSVLLAVSASDTRRQTQLRAGHHLLTCSVCSAVSQPLLRRRSVLAAVLPWLGLGSGLGMLRRLAHNRPVQATAAVTAASLGAAGLVVAMHRPAHSTPAATTNRATVSTAAPPAKPSGTLVRASDGTPLLPVPNDLTAMAGDTVTGRDLPVSAVPADEGFWVGDGTSGRIWVQLTRERGESPFTVKAGDRVSFTGKVAGNESGFAHRVGVTPQEGSRTLTRQGAHLTVPEQSLKISNS